MSDAKPTNQRYPVPHTEWRDLHSRIGFLEGALLGLQYIDPKEVKSAIERIESHYQKMCARKP